tara:strand:- start:43 stop:1995 length:1953 start_codon:yes stop_codon:yes gene_type:complete
MLDKKYFLVTLLFFKYFILLRIIPDLEITRYVAFFEQCINFKTCINPYSNIDLLEKQYLTFPYSNFMYFVLLPFYFIANFLNFSFVNLSYLFFEILLIFILRKLFNISFGNLYLILVLNPVIIYSIGILGQLDFIPLTFFIVSLYYLKNKEKYYSILFLILSLTTKIVFLILLPIIVLYFLKIDETLKDNGNTIFYTLIVGILFNFQLLFDKAYSKTVFFGINRGYDVVSDSSNLFSNNVLFIMLFLSFTFFMFWRNIHRLDFVGVCIFTSFMTLPIYITNLSNIGWVLWSFPSFVILFYSYEYKTKTLIILFFSILVIANEENEFVSISNDYLEILNYLIYFSSILIIYYLFEILTKNIYYKIKSSPIIISIAGDSAVGKTTLSQLLNNYFGDKFVDKVELDSFHKFERDDPAWEEYTHLNPDMNNLIEFKNTVLNLINGETEIIRNYNHLTGKFDSTNKKRIKNFLIIEGLHSLYFNDLNQKYDLNVFLDLEEQIKKDTKLSRDLKRKKKKEKILEEIKKRKKDFEEHILPQYAFSDIYIKTILRDEVNVKFKLFFKNDYFFDFKSVVEGVEGIMISNEKQEPGLVQFDLNISNKDYVEFFNLLTENLSNLKNNKFKVTEIGDVGNSELLCKLALILFMLNKKIETKL